jgi:hypothetical protein
METIQNYSLKFTPVKFQQNLKREKQVALKWSVKRRKKDERLLLEIEEHM